MSTGIDRLNALPRFSGSADDSFKPGLDRIRAMLAAMDDPHRAYDSVHVAGTNGKGSTASMLAAMATAAGLRTGLHTSPELVHVTERMRIDGTPAPDDWLDDAVLRHANLLDRLAPSFFEATVAFSFLYFAEEDVDLAVVEVGLGGRLDATNVLTPRASVITSIDLEHTALLGDTLAEIAAEKAGIIKPDVPCVTGVVQPEALAAIRDVANERSAPLHVLEEEGTVQPTAEAPAETPGRSLLRLSTPTRTCDDLALSIAGAHQHRNAWLAVRAAEVAGLEVSDAALREGLANVATLAGLRGRLEVLTRDPAVYIDVAHNPSSLAATLDALAPKVSGQLVVGLALANDKSRTDIARLLASRSVSVLPLVLRHDRLLTAEDLAHDLAAQGVTLLPAATLPEAQHWFEHTGRDGDVLLLTGSHHVVREAIGAPS